MKDFKTLFICHKVLFFDKLDWKIYKGGWALFIICGLSVGFFLTYLSIFQSVCTQIDHKIGDH
jgi:hypothetical protein